jgi:hypothetical protein
MAKIIAAENTNVPESATNAQPGPMLATKAPPTSGPISVHEMGRTNWPSEFACTNRSSGTIVGTIELNAGAKIACPAPYTTTSRIRIGSVKASTIDR